jgi:excinuclease ABC subunit C
VRRLNDLFLLRDCPQAQEMIFADQAELFPILRAAGCIRHEIGTCLAPCAAACSRAAYGERVRAAQAFLAGENLTPLATLESDMTAASAALAFERAAALRDKREALSWLNRSLERLRLARQKHSFVYPVPGEDGRDRWYLIRRGWVAAAIPAPRDEAGRQGAAAAIDSVFERPNPWTEPTGAAQIDTVLLVTSWFGRHPEERKLTLEPAAARALLSSLAPPARLV